MRILLTERGVEALNAPVAGHDEFSDLLRRMQGYLTGNMLMVAPEDWALLLQFAEHPGDAEVSARAQAIREGAVRG
jgi:hypothetical protein